ncbi:hypothetical protein GH741_12740 [Aquibacillus halophilus]|uniref:DUF4830 domain-containing protein n=1 Tax=Aquibacillus halophilus TaxID=930132 RepID=A0A6A8DKN8_9BACI|nr:hypothetical protein [Aquibacillus halophilus]MRH43547.1 hypothetical protein [Aquibacillus halophilus]
MKTFKIGFIVILFFFILVGCQQDDLSDTATVAKEHLEELGFEVLSYEQHQEKYELTSDKVDSDQLDPNSIWQEGIMNNPKPYIGENVDVEKFAVKNHPLDDKQCCGNVNAEEKVYTYVYIVEEQVVGGIAIPDVLDGIGLKGGFWSSLDGEMKATMSY